MKIDQLKDVRVSINYPYENVRDHVTGMQVRVATGNPTKITTLVFRRFEVDFKGPVDQELQTLIEVRCHDN